MRALGTRVVSLSCAAVVVMWCTATEPLAHHQAPPSAAAGVSVLRRARAGLGGDAAFARVRSLTVEYSHRWTTNASDEPRASAFTIGRPDRFSSTVLSFTHTLVGDAFWQSVDNPESIRETARRNTRVNFWIWSLVFLLDPPPDAGLVLTSAGRRTIAGVAGEALDITGPDAFQMTLLFESRSSRPLLFAMPWQTMDSGGGGGEERPRIAKFFDYRTVAGVLFPYRIEDDIGAFHARLQVTRVQVNAPTVERLFAPPRR